LYTYLPVVGRLDGLEVVVGVCVVDVMAVMMIYGRIRSILKK